MNCRHDGKRKPRGHCGKKPLLGHYLIITDAEKTEKQYFEGIRDSFSSELRRRIVIKVERALTKDLLDYALYSRAENPNVNSTWVVLDRDEAPGFDSLIENAEKNGIEVGWSNPCFETWLHAYFGRMPNFSDAKKAIDEFKREFQKKDRGFL